MSTLSVHRLENVQDFDMANTPFTTAFNAANGAYAATNAAFNTTNTAYNFANTVNTFAYGVAVNSAAAFAAANNVAPQVTPAFLTGNLAYALANNAYASINSNWTVTNALYSLANSAYGAANNVGPQIAPTYNTANAAYNQANSAFTFANTRFSSSGGTISGAVEITADLTVHGNTRFVDQQTLSVGDPLIYLAANNYASDVVDIGFVANYVNTGGANVHTGLYRSSGTKEYYLFYGYDKEPYNNYIDPTGNNITMAVLNATVRTSNLILGGANTINWIKSGYSVANAAFGVANTALQNTSGTFAGSLTVTGSLAAGGQLRSTSQGGNFIYPADSGYEWWTGAWNDYVSYQITRRNTSTGTGYPYFMIDTSGNVGIGTTSPSSYSKFSVIGGAITSGTNASTTGSVILRGYYGSGAISTFGTEYSSGGPVIGYGVKPSTSASGSFISSSGVALTRGAYTIAGYEHVWYSGGNQTVAEDSAVTVSEKMRLNSSGYLGILQSSPQKMLHVGSAGNAHAYVGDVFLYDDGQSHVHSINSKSLFLNSAASLKLNAEVTGNIDMVVGGGKVGLGTASPAYSLDAGSRTDAFRIPVGTTAQRPTGTTGLVRFNTTTGYPEWYDSSSSTWIQFNQGVPYSVEVLIVAGGGGGGMHSGGGGGAGGLLYYGAEIPKTPNGPAISVTGGVFYSIVVGAGGAASGGNYTSVPGYGYNGTDSSAFGYTAIAGGGGGSGGNGQPGKSGGSGGGGGRTSAGGSGTTGQGNSGGYWNSGAANYPGGGGGGASAAGAGGDGSHGGNGGNGYAYSISGASTYYSGGGGGNLQYGGIQGTGGLGGGANGNSGDGIDATVNTGGGGGGAEYTSGKGGGIGGSGVVIIRYAGAQRGSGGTVTSSGGYTIHKFTSSGTFTA